MSYGNGTSDNYLVYNTATGSTGVDTGQGQYGDTTPSGRQGQGPDMSGTDWSSQNQGSDTSGTYESAVDDLFGGRRGGSESYGNAGAGRDSSKTANTRGQQQQQQQRSSSSSGDKMRGGVEKVASKLTMNPDLVGKGQQTRLTGQYDASSGQNF